MRADNIDIKQAVILAGGRGERLRPYTDENPKPLYPIHDVPFIEYLIRQVNEFGIKNIVILLGYLADKVIETIGDGKRFGVNITYDMTDVESGTADRIRHANDILEDAYLLMYCDNYCPIDYSRLFHDFRLNNADIQVSVYSNKDHYTKDNVIVDSDGKISAYDKKRKLPGLQGVDIGYALVRRDVIKLLDDNTDSFAAIYPLLVKKKSLYATVTDHRYYSIGSYDRISLTEQFFTRKRAVFLDRDGVLNKRPAKADYVKEPKEFEWLPGAKKAVKLLNDAGITTILFSNQPGIARGVMTEADLKTIENKMDGDLASLGAAIDYKYYCLHGWDEGCDCRKPKPGLLYMAQKDLSLNLRECVVFGDDERDMEAGRSAGCGTVMVSEDYPLINAVEDYLKEI